MEFLQLLVGMVACWLLVGMVACWHSMELSCTIIVFTVETRFVRMVAVVVLLLSHPHLFEVFMLFGASVAVLCTGFAARSFNLSSRFSSSIVLIFFSKSVTRLFSEAICSVCSAISCCIFFMAFSFTLSDLSFVLSCFSLSLRVTSD